MTERLQNVSAGSDPLIFEKGAKMVLYSTDCPKCTVLEMKLTQADISFTKITDKNKMAELGFRSAPMLEYCGQYFNFHDAMNLINTMIEEREDVYRSEIR